MCQKTLTFRAQTSTHRFLMFCVGFAAAIVDAIGRRVCSGSKLCLKFGRVGSLVAKDRRLGFQFADGFRRPRMDPAATQVGQTTCAHRPRHQFSVVLRGVLAA